MCVYMRGQREFDVSGGDRKSSVWRYPKQSFGNGRLATEISRFVLPERLFSICKGKNS